MPLEPWYKVVTLREEVREGRSFSPDEFAIALEQVVAGTAPKDYRDPAEFFARTCFTRALVDHAGMVLRRLAGSTADTAPVLTLITQFGGGKTHTLASLYHIAKAGAKAGALPGVAELLAAANLHEAPQARVGVFVGNAWDPAEGRENPWIDLARQIAGETGVAALGSAARTTPPGTESLARLFAAADAPALLLFDEVLNFINRHRNLAESFHAFIQNLTVAVTGTSRAAAVISLPRSQVEMTDWDQQWQERITKVVRRVARDLIANDESEISEVVCRRLFQGLGKPRVRKKVSKTYADWCFERTARLPAEWLAVDSATTEAKAREFLRGRFEACYPFHPATLSVFQRKWRALPQFQQTRGALAMLAQWISWAAREHFQGARTEPLITLGSAPLDVPAFRAVVLGQLAEARLDVAIDADIAGPLAHAQSLDADATGALRNIHRRVGAAILFESSGGQVDKTAHLPELRFALGEPEVDTTTIDNAAAALEAAGFFIRKVGTDGFRIHHQATLKKVVSDRRASLDEETEIKPAIRQLVETGFKRGANVPIVLFPSDSSAVADSPRLALVALAPDSAWTAEGDLRKRLAGWTRERGGSPRLYPGALVWCAAKPGKALRQRAELMLAWQRVAKELADGSLGAEYNPADRAEVRSQVRAAEEAAQDEVWASYRFVALRDKGEPHDLKLIDLGAGHSSSSETLAGRVIQALKGEALLNESVGAGYIERHWPPAFKETGAWPLTSLRQSFLDGSLTRLSDPDAVLKRQIVQFVGRGDFGLASGPKAEGGFERMWHETEIHPEEVAFEKDVFLLKKAAVEARNAAPAPAPAPTPAPPTPPPPTPAPAPVAPQAGETTVRLTGTLPPEMWNRLGTKVLPKLRQGENVTVAIDCSARVEGRSAESLVAEIEQALADLDLDSAVAVTAEQAPR